MKYRVVRGVSYAKPGSRVDLYRWEPGSIIDMKDILAIRPKLDPPLDVEWLVAKGALEKVE